MKTFAPSFKYLSLIPSFFVITGLLISPYFLIFAALMFLFLFLKIKYTSITVHDDRIELATGILMKLKQEAYFNKINNMDFLQNPVQSYLNVGSLSLMTGNDRPMTLQSIENVSELVALINSKRNK